MSKNKLKVYIAGPVTGKPIDETKKLFNKGVKAVRALGMTPVNPLELNCTGENWYEDMRICIKALCDCNLIYMLPGWEHSQGARIECETAKKLSINQIKIKL